MSESLSHDIRVISVLRSNVDQYPRGELRIVSWNREEPVLERRIYKQDKVTGEWRSGKCRGLTLKDVSYIVANWPDVQRMMLEEKP